MGRHSAHRADRRPGRARAERRWFGHGRTRALLSLGTVVALGATGTSAYWTDTATIAGGAVTAGSMDLQVQTPSDDTWRHVGVGTDPEADSALSIPALTPGESMAFDFGARNVGNPDLRYAVTLSGTWSQASNPLAVRFHEGDAENTTAYPRTGSCTGDPLGGGSLPVTTAPQEVFPARELDGGGPGSTGGEDESLCLLVSMDPGAASDQQGEEGSLEITFTAHQVVP